MGSACSTQSVYDTNTQRPLCTKEMTDYEKQIHLYHLHMFSNGPVIKVNT